MRTTLTSAAVPHTGAVVVTPTSPLWYSTRATGLVALVLITLSVVLGLLTSLRFARPTWPRFVTVGVHRNLSLVVLVFVGLHIVTTVTDSYAHIHLLDAIVPFVSSYRPLWLGLGAASFDLLLAVAISSLLRTHVGHRSWRFIHWLSYLCWPSAVLHSLGTGTDTRQRWVLVITACCVASVVAAGAWRLAAGAQRHTVLRAAVAGGAVIALAVGGAWLFTGPLKPGWARRAGTPASLLARPAGSVHSAQAGGPLAGAAPTKLPPVPFAASVSGQVSQGTDPGTGDAIVRIHTTATRGGARSVPNAILDIVITGQADASGGVTMSASRVTFGPPGAPNQYTGSLVNLNGTAMAARVRDGAGHGLLLRISLQPDGGLVTGTLQVSSARSAGEGGK